MSTRPAAPRLGRGLAALFGDIQEGGASAGEVRTVPIDLIDPNPFQPRTTFDDAALNDLAESIKARGILQPMLVRPNPDQDGRFQIVAGERRWRAAALAGLHDVPVIVRTLSDIDSAAVALIENLQRENLNPIEEAEGYHRLIEHFGLTHEALGLAVSKSRAHVGNIVRLLSLPAPVRDEVRKGALSLGHARAMLTLPDPAAVAADVVKKGLSVRQTERLVQRLQNPPATIGDTAPAPDTAAVEQDLMARTGYRVKLAASPRGDGTLTIWFSDLFQLDEIIARLGGQTVTPSDQET